MTTQKYLRWFLRRRVPPSTDFLRLAASWYLQPTDASKPQDSTSGFKYYLEQVRKVVIVDVSFRQQLESLWVTVECSSLRKLKELWYDHRRKYLNELAQNTLVSKEILEVLGLTDVKLRTTISERQYKDCRVQFLWSLGEFESFFLLVFSYLPLVSIVTVDPDEQGNKHERSSIFSLFLIEGLCCFIVHLFSWFSASSEKR